MTIEIALLISIVSVAFSIFFGIKNSKRTDTKDIEERVKENTKIQNLVFLEDGRFVVSWKKWDISQNPVSNQDEEYAPDNL